MCSVLKYAAFVVDGEAAWTDFDVPVADDGSYSIIVGGKTWLTSSPLFVYKDGHRWTIGTHYIFT